MKTGDRVQVFDERYHRPIGWGTIVQVARNVHTDEEVPLIMLEGKSQRKIWGDRCDWITEEAFVKGGIRIFKDMKERDRK